MRSFEDFRIFLSAFDEKAFHCYASWKNDLGNLGFDAGGILRFHSRAELKSWFDGYKPGTSMLLSILTKDTESPIGAIAINNLDYRNQTCSLGMMIGDRSQQSQGLGKEAAILALTYVFHELNMHKVNMNALATNVSSIRGIESLGGVREGIQREQVLRHGKRQDFEFWSLFRRHFEERYPQAMDSIHSGIFFVNNFRQSKE